MPGVMETILNLGLTDAAVEGLAAATGNRRFAYDAYRRLINMFGDVVMGVDHEHFERAFSLVKTKYHVTNDTEVPEKGMVEVVDAYKEVYRKKVGDVFPQNPFKQLELAIEAVFKSWNAERAIAYRRLAGITGLNGTAVNVQSMVYGNMGDDSGTGVAFTRNPSTGEDHFYGEFLVNAQGEDVVAGIRTPRSTDEMPSWNKAAYTQLLKIKDKLERHYRDMQDIEFTIERGKLYMLQTRNGKRTGPAAVRIAVEMVKETLISKKEAVLRVDPQQLDQLLHPVLDPKSKKELTLIAKGLPASPGASVGMIAFTAEAAVEASKKGPVVLVRKETQPDDIQGMEVSKGILTSRGGMTSHAAVVCRGMGTPCVAGAETVTVDEHKKLVSVTVGGKQINLKEGDWLSLDGSTGEVFAGKANTIEADPTSGILASFMS